MCYGLKSGIIGGCRSELIPHFVASRNLYTTRAAALSGKTLDKFLHCEMLSISNLCAEHISNEPARQFDFGDGQLTIDLLARSAGGYDAGAFEHRQML